MITDKLLGIQTALKAPKNQTNTFGGYNYRSCEDILEAVKPLLEKAMTTLNLSDEIVEVGGRIYVKATATLYDCSSYTEGHIDTISATGYAREEESKKGMDASQITGSASSYARKYALNGLFCIDDTKDADATNTHGKDAPPPPARDDYPFEVKDTAKASRSSVCADCGVEITDAEKKYSEKYFKRALCRECQKNAR